MKRFGPGRGWSALTGERGVRRKQHPFGILDLPVFWEEPGGGGGGGGGAGDDTVQLTDDLKKSDPEKYWRVYWKRETNAAAAFKDRDETKRRIQELEKGQMTPEQRKEYDTLKANQAKLEEDRKRKEGEFDQWRADINQKHADELKTRDERLASLEKEIAGGEVRRAFLAATDYFGGGETSKTVLVADLAVDALGKYVSYEDYDFGHDGGGKKKTLIVRDSHGQIIRGQNGRPAPFNEAIEPLIKSLPAKDHIFRGSGKTGSGARGEGVLDDKDAVDLSRPLTDAQKRNPKVLQQLEDHGGGGVQMGRGFTKAATLARTKGE